MNEQAATGELGGLAALRNIPGLSDESNVIGTFTQNEILRDIGMNEPSVNHSIERMRQNVQIGENETLQEPFMSLSNPTNNSQQPTSFQFEVAQRQIEPKSNFPTEDLTSSRRISNYGTQLK